MNNAQSLTNIDALAIDMDGVLWHGEQVFPGFKRFYEFMRRKNIAFTMATNNASKTQAQYVKKFAKFGVEIFPEEVMTSSLATAEFLKTEYTPGTRLHVLGMDGIREAVSSAGFEVADTDVEAVVVGLDFELTYEKLKTAVILINQGARYIGTNPDLTFPSPEGFAPGNGSILAAISAATGQTPITIGKPEPLIFQAALNRMGTDPARTAMLGDRLETDILGGQRAGLKTILVLSGVTRPEMVAESDLKPDWTFDNISALTEAWEKELEEA